MKMMKPLILMVALCAALPTFAQTVGGGGDTTASFEGLGTADAIDLSTNRITISGESYRLASGARFLDASNRPVNPAEMSGQRRVSFVFQFSGTSSNDTLPTPSNGVVSEVRAMAGG